MKTALASLFLLASAAAASAQEAIRVTPENFIRAETDMYFGNFIKDSPLGTLGHKREPASIDNQTVIRLNRDTLYSFGAFDLDAGPVTVTMPDTGGRFMSLLVISEDHYAEAFYGTTPVTVTKDNVGTRYVSLAFRTLIDPNDPKDVEEVHRLQDAIKAEQPGGPGTFEVPVWDKASQDKVRSALLALAATAPSLHRAFGKKDDVDPVNRLIAAAAGWGGNPDKDAMYLNGTPDNNDGKTVYKLKVGNDVPVDGFWSISLYNAKGYFEKNDLNAYSANNITAKKDADGGVTVQFGDCKGDTPNCLPIMEGWNYLVRLYRPRKELLDGSWKFPDAQAAK